MTPSEEPVTPTEAAGRVANRSVGVDLRALYGKAPDDLVEMLMREVKVALWMARAGNSRRRSFHPFAMNIGGPGQSITAMPQGSVGAPDYFTALLRFARTDSQLCIAIVPYRRPKRFPRRAAVLFVEHHDGMALEITVPFIVDVFGKTRFSPATVRTCPRRVWAGSR
jgi:hypothetical protein